MQGVLCIIFKDFYEISFTKNTAKNISNSVDANFENYKVYLKHENICYKSL